MSILSFECRRYVFLSLFFHSGQRLLGVKGLKDVNDFNTLGLVEVCG